MKLLLVIVFIFSSKLFAASYLLYSAQMPTVKIRLQENNVQFKNVFTDHEQKIYQDFDLPLNILRLETNKSPTQLKQMLKDLKFKLEANSKATLQSDHLLTQQWALNNDGSNYIERTSDIDVNVIEGVAGEDIGLQGVVETANNKILIAVVDSGVDFKHPDLKSNIYSSPKECDALAKFDECIKTQRDKAQCYKQWANSDADGNGYPLDCNGYNIAGKSLRLSKSQGNHMVLDKVGHGTHIAGIIGAVKNNGFGVRGAMENVKILPVQINGAINQRELSANETAIDLIAKGVLYAIKTGAQIINLSLGWPLNEDSTLMRKVVELAHKNNVLIVAAAGNSGHASPTYPCSYDYVLCVGSHGVNGRLTDFSNYGTSVDINAPGQNILSTWPVLMRPRKFTEGAGFEYQNGTSFSAPYVVAGLGILLNKGLSPQDAVARLLKASRPNHTKKSHTRHGNLDINKALTTKLESFLYPLNKAPYLIHWKKGEVRKFNLKIKNIGKDLSESQFSISAYDETISMLSPNFATGVWHAGEEKTFPITFNSADDMESDLYFKLFIKTPHEQKTYDIHAMALTIITPEYESNSLHKLIQNGDFLKNATLMEIKNFDRDTKGTDFLALKSIKGQTHIALVKDRDTYFEVTPEFKFPIRNPAILHLARVDIDQDGISEYVFASANASEQTGNRRQETRFFIFNPQLTPSNIKVAHNNSYNNQNSIMPGSFIWIKHANRMVPAWINIGLRPEHERTVGTPWKPAPRERSLYRIFYLTPDKVNTIALEGDDTNAVAFLQTPLEKRYLGMPLLIVAKGFGFFKNYELFKLDNKLHLLKKINLPNYQDLLGLDPNPMMTKGSSFNVFFNSANSLGDQRVTRIEWSNGKINIGSEHFKSFNPDYPIFRILNTYSDGAFYQTKFHIAYFDKRTSSHSIINSKVEPDQRYHRIIGNDKAIYLSSRYTPSLASEVISTRYEQKSNKELIYRSSLWRTLGAKGCEAIGFINKDSKPYLYFLCENPSKFILLPY